MRLNYVNVRCLSEEHDNLPLITKQKWQSGYESTKFMLMTPSLYHLFFRFLNMVLIMDTMRLIKQLDSLQESYLYDGEVGKNH